MLDGLKDYMRDMPAYHPKFFRVAAPKAPRFPAEDLYRLIPFNQKQMYNFDEVLARLVDGSEHMEFRPGYGPEVYTGLVQGRRLPGRGSSATARDSWAETTPSTPTTPASAASCTARA